MNPKHIKFDVTKDKGFRGYKFTATTYIDDKGNQIVSEPKEGSDIIEIRVEQRLSVLKGILTDSIARDLIQALEKGALSYKPIYEI